MRHLDFNQKAQAFWEHINRVRLTNEDIAGLFGYEVLQRELTDADLSRSSGSPINTLGDKVNALFVQQIGPKGYPSLLQRLKATSTYSIKIDGFPTDIVIASHRATSTAEGSATHERDHPALPLVGTPFLYRTILTDDSEYFIVVNYKPTMELEFVAYSMPNGGPVKGFPPQVLNGRFPDMLKFGFKLPGYEIIFNSPFMGGSMPPFHLQFLKSNSMPGQIILDKIIDGNVHPRLSVDLLVDKKYIRIFNVVGYGNPIHMIEGKDPRAVAAFHDFYSEVLSDLYRVYVTSSNEEIPDFIPPFGQDIEFMGPEVDPRFNVFLRIREGNVPLVKYALGLFNRPSSYYTGELIWGTSSRERMGRIITLSNRDALYIAGNGGVISRSHEELSPPKAMILEANNSIRGFR